MRARLMSRNMIPSCLAVAAMAMLSFAHTSEAQIFDRLKKRAERVAEDEVGKKLESATRDAVRCALGDKACADKAQKDGKSAVFVDAKGNTVTDSNGKPITDADEAVRSEEAPGSGVWRNYDFVPGTPCGTRWIWIANKSDGSRRNNWSLSTATCRSSNGTAIGCSKFRIIRKSG